MSWTEGKPVGTQDASRLLATALLTLLLLIWFPHAQAARHALLVGIGTYQERDIRPLEGPLHDVSALREVLQQRWGFRAENIRSLLDAQATRSALLAEIDALETRSRPGDEILIYFSGHGSSKLHEDDSDKPVPHGSGALLAYDFRNDHAQIAAGTGLVVGRHDLVPRILRLESGQRRLWVVVDACYSGQAVREASGATQRSDLPIRSIRIPRPDLAASIGRLSRTTSQRPPPPPYPYRATAYLAASDEGETAKDIGRGQLAEFPTRDGRPHGAFTDALLRVLHGEWPADLNGDGWMDLQEVHRAVGDFMAGRRYGHTAQRLPSLADDSGGLLARPVLAVPNAATSSAPTQRTPPPLALHPHPDLPAPIVSRLAAAPGLRPVASVGQAGLVVQPSQRTVGAIDLEDAAGDLIRTWPAARTDDLLRHAAQMGRLHHIRALAERGRSGDLVIEYEPVLGQGQTYVVGQSIRMAFQPVSQGWLLVFDLDADGRFVPLYPLGRPQTARQTETLYRSRAITITLPEGKDTQFGFVFQREPKELEIWAERAQQLGLLLRQAGPLAEREATRLQDDLQTLLERMLRQEAGAFLFGHASFRTVRQP